MAGPSDPPSGHPSGETPPLGSGETWVEDPLRQPEDPGGQISSGGSVFGGVSGRRLGPYELVRELARGGMGVVYVAWDPRLERRVAVKVLPGGTLHASSDQVARFIREARAVASLDHPGVVRVYDIGEEDDGVYFAMDLVEGGNLAEHLSAYGSLEVGEAAELLARISRALAAAHARGIVHRDMKPGNVLLERDGTPRLTDFGLAAQLDDVDSRLTNAGQVLGTPAYMAPEQARGDLESISPATDVYAVGVIAFELLTGRRPWDQEGLALVLAKPELDPVSPRQLAPEVPAELDLIVRKATAREPEERYPNATALADDIERFLRGEPIHAQEPAAITRLRWFVRRNRRVLPAWGGGVLALLALGGAAWQATADERRARAREVAASGLWELVDGRMSHLRSVGRTEEAQRAFEDFVNDPDVQRTEVLSIAWGGEAARSESTEDRLDALSRAFLSAREGERQRDLLVDIGQVFVAQYAPAQVSSVVRSLEERGLTDSREARALQAWASMSELRLADAAEQWAALEGQDDPRARLARALGEATVLPEGCGSRRCLLWNADGVGLPEVVLFNWGDLRLRSLEGAPDRVWEGVGDVGWTSQYPTPEVAEELLVSRKEGLALVSPGEGAPQVELIQGLEGDLWFPRHLGDADLDGDGQDETWLGVDRTVVRVPRLGEDRVIEAPLRSLDLINSDVMAMVHEDLDGDGRPELVLASAEWEAFDVRVYDTEGELTLRDRVRLGEVYGLQVIPGEQPLLAALVRRMWTPRLELFPGDEGFEGIVLFRLGEQGLEEVGRHELGTGWFKRLVAEDVDGDGLTDLLLTAPGGLAILVNDGQGGFVQTLLDHQVLLGTIQADDDPAVELVLQTVPEDYLWIAGAGTDAPPALVRTHAQSLLLPEVGDVWLREAWELAEELVAIGLNGEAAELLWQQVVLSRGEEGSASARARAMQLMADAEDWVALQQASQDQASWTGMSQDDLQAVRGALSAGVLFAEEAEVLGAISDDTEASARLAYLSAFLAAEPSVLDFSEGIDGRVRVRVPEVVSHRPQEGGLGIDVSKAASVFELPLTLGAGPAELQLEMELQDVEWGGQLVVSLVPEGDQDGASRVEWWRLTAQGGQGLNHLAGGNVRASLPFAAVQQEGALRVGLETASLLEASTGRTRFFLQTDDARTFLVAGQAEPGELPPPGRYRLVFSTVSMGCGGGAFLLRRVSVRGAGTRFDDAGESDPLEEAARLAVSGWPERALELLGGAEGVEADRVRLEALRRLGESEQAELVFGALVEEPEWRESVLLSLLRHEPGQTRGWAEGALGTGWFDAWWAAWSCSLGQPDPLQRTVEQGTQATDKVEEVSLAPGLSEERRLAAVEALVDLGLAWHGLGRPERGRRTLSGAEEALSWIQGDELRRQTLQGRIHQARAAMLAEQGELGRDEALRELAAAIALSPTPELVVDSLQVDARFGALHESPGWK